LQPQQQLNQSGQINGNNGLVSKKD
jgi:hypothetical protein